MSITMSTLIGTIHSKLARCRAWGWLAPCCDSDKISHDINVHVLARETPVPKPSTQTFQDRYDSTDYILLVSGQQTGFECSCVCQKTREYVRLAVGKVMLAACEC